MSKTSEESQQGTRNQIMEAAGNLFAAKGLEKTSTREITDAAGTNVASVNYHFGSKENLFKEVVRARARACQQDRMEVLEGCRAGGEDFAQTLRAFVRVHVGMITGTDGSGADVAIFFRELSNPGPGFDIILEEMIRPTHKVLVELFTENVPGMTEEKATLSIFSLMGQMMHVVRGGKIIPRLLERKLDEGLVDKICDHIVDYSLWGMCGKAAMK